MAALAQYENPPYGMHGAYEHYFGGGSGGRKWAGELDYVETGADLTSTTSIEGSISQMHQWTWVEDVFMRFARGDNALKVGRFRSALGFSDWSEMYYTPINALPMVRDYYANIAPGLPLNRNDRGVEYSGG